MEGVTLEDEDECPKSFCRAEGLGDVADFGDAIEDFGDNTGDFAPLGTSGATSSLWWG